MVILDARPWYVRALDRLDAGHGAGVLLAPLGSVVAAATKLACRLRRGPELPARPLTVGIGNLRVGGTGKTPVVADLARRWREQGHEVAVATRGYRSTGGDDEPGWLKAQGLRTLVDADRASAVVEAGRQGADIVLLDDALQSRHEPTITLAIVLDRDLDRCPRPLPAGPAREGSQALRRADALLVRVENDPWPVAPERDLEYQRRAETMCGGPAFAFRSLAEGLVDAHGRCVQLEAGQRALLVSGLARPESFERDARTHGLPVRGAARFEDHAAFDPRQRARIAAFASKVEATCLVCPEKNAARLWGALEPLPTYALRATLEWGGRDPLELLDPILRR